MLILLSALAGFMIATGDKTQAVRMADIFVVGPLLIMTRDPIISAIGGATIGYNLKNYLAQESENVGRIY